MEETGTTTEFMLAEYQDLYQNIMHLENKLFNHLSFFTTLFVGIVTVSITIFRLAGRESTALSRPTTLALLSLLFLLFLVVARLELRMTTELRIRKMKFIEGITKIRQYFVDKDEAIEDYLVLPVGIKKAPPYLRVRCKDWYQILYVSLMNGMAAFVTWGLPLWFFIRLVKGLVGGLAGLILTAMIVPGWIAVGFLIFYFMFWHFSYKSVVEFCRRYDEMRTDRIGAESEYDLMEPPLPKSRLKWTFGDWMAFVTQAQQRTKR